MDHNNAFKALADPTRRDILALLRKGEMTAGGLAEKFDMTKPSMSHHFAVLKDADLVSSRREGQQIWYALNTTVVEDVMAWAMHLIGEGTSKGAKHDTQSAATSRTSDRSRPGRDGTRLSSPAKPRSNPLGSQPKAKRV
jgi:ArsR family transcriptional regulator